LLLDSFCCFFFIFTGVFFRHFVSEAFLREGGHASLTNIFKEFFRINKVEMSCLTKSSSASCSPDEKHVKQINGLFE